MEKKKKSHYNKFNTIVHLLVSQTRPSEIGTKFQTFQMITKQINEGDEKVNFKQNNSQNVVFK